MQESNGIQADRPRLRLAHNILHMLFSTFASSASLFLGNLVILLHYGRKQHGLLVWHVSVIYLATHLAGLVTSKAGVRLIARARAERPEDLGETTSSLITVQTVFAAALAIAMALFAGPLAGIKNDGAAYIFQLGALWVFFNSIARTGVMLAVGLERMSYVVLINPSAEIVKFLWACLCVVAQFDIFTLLMGWTAAYFLSAVVAIWCGLRLSRSFSAALRLRAHGLAETLRMLVHSLPYFVPFFSVFAPPLLLTIYIGAADAGTTNRNIFASMFQFCFSLALISRMLSLSVATAMFPRVAHIDASDLADHSQTAAILIRAGRTLAMVGTLVFAVLSVASGPILARQAFYGQDVGQAYATLMVLCFAVAADNVAQLYDQVLAATRHATFTAIVELAKYGVLGALAFLGQLIRPDLPAAGAAMALAAATLLTLAAKIPMVRRELPAAGVGILVRMFALLGAMGIAAFLVTNPRVMSFLPESLPAARWSLRCVPLIVWVAGVYALGLLARADLRHWTDILRGLWRSRART